MLNHCLLFVVIFAVFFSLFIQALWIPFRKDRVSMCSLHFDVSNLLYFSVIFPLFFQDSWIFFFFYKWCFHFVLRQQRKRLMYL